MAIPSNDFLTKPYEDDSMYYDYKKRRYVLKLSETMKETGIMLDVLWQNSDNAEGYLRMVSDVCDTYVSQFKDSRYYEKLRYYLSHSKKMREAIYELMIDTVRYNFRNGGFMIAYETGINLNEMKELRMKIADALSVIGDEIANKNDLKNRFFRYNFDVVPSSPGNEW